MDLATEQQRVCERHGASFVASPPRLIVGINRPPLSEKPPINGLRHPLGVTTAGWYLWADDYSSADDFFLPVHVSHIDELLPAALSYLGLPPGGR